MRSASASAAGSVIAAGATLARGACSRYASINASSSRWSTGSSTRATNRSGSASPPERCSRMYSRSTCSTSLIALSRSITVFLQAFAQCLLEAVGHLVHVVLRLASLFGRCLCVRVLEPVELDDALVLIVHAVHGALDAATGVKAGVEIRLDRQRHAPNFLVALVLLGQHRLVWPALLLLI